MKQIENKGKEILEKDDSFKGYTLEELRYQRALTAIQLEFCKTKLLRQVEHLKNNNPLTPTGAAASIPGKMGYLASKLLSGLNYLDYAMVGFTLFGTARKVFSFFRRRK